MNWEAIRIGIDVLSILMAIVMAIVLYIAYKSYKKVKFAVKPMMGFGNAHQQKIKDEEEEEKEKDNPPVVNNI